jgi:cytochrome c
MKRAMLICLAAAAMVSNFAFAADAKVDPADLAKSKNCMACHAIQTKVLGPAYKDVATKYAGDKGAEAKLVDKVMKGGSGTWGAVPMPANTQVSKEEATTLVKWVLSQK